jgi:hypothetical protein
LQGNMLAQVCKYFVLILNGHVTRRVVLMIERLTIELAATLSCVMTVSYIEQIYVMMLYGQCGKKYACDAADHIEQAV